MSARVVIGMEVHLQLRTSTKLFCACTNDFGGAPNSRVCPVCLGLPGALPVLNRSALTLARRLAAALGADIASTVSFDRKHYFYPDLPKGYQITQVDRPVARGGAVPVPGRAIPLVRLHLEEDAGATAEGVVDWNRAGVPLVEIVSEPEIRTAEEAVEYVRSLREIARFTDASDAEMSRGNLRCEPNVNLVLDDGRATPIVEIKNLNSLASLAAAIGHEVARQRSEPPGDARETRGLDVDRGVTFPMRDKEESADYRYFPDPDLPPVTGDPVEAAATPELPGAIRDRWTRAWDLGPRAARDLTASPDLSRYFDTVVGDGGRDVARTAVGFVLTDVLRDGGEPPLPAERLAGLVRLVAAGRITRATARTEVWPVLVAEDRPAEEIVASLGLDTEVTDLDALVADAIAADPTSAETFRRGKEAAIGPLVGAVLRAARGRADPVRVRQLIRAALG